MGDITMLTGNILSYYTHLCSRIIEQSIKSKCCSIHFKHRGISIYLYRLNTEHNCDVPEDYTKLLCV